MIWRLIETPNFAILLVKRVGFLGISKEEVETWICAEEFDKGPNYDLFYSFITKIACINDNAERNIRLIHNFVAASKRIIVKKL